MKTAAENKTKGFPPNRCCNLITAPLKGASRLVVQMLLSHLNLWYSVQSFVNPLKAPNSFFKWCLPIKKSKTTPQQSQICNTQKYKKTVYFGAMEVSNKNIVRIQSFC